MTGLPTKEHLAATLSVNGWHFGFPESMPHPSVLAAVLDFLPMNVNVYGRHARAGTATDADHPHRDAEVQVINGFRSLLGQDNLDSGYVTSGATEAILFGAWVAARRLRPHRAAVVSSETAHVAVRKALSITALDEVRQESISCGDQQVDELKAVAERLRTDGVSHAALFLTWWDALSARSDQVDVLCAAARASGVAFTIVVDAAFGGLLSAALSGPPGSWGADVVAMDLYKAAMGPTGVGVALCTEEAAQAVEMAAEYLPYGVDGTITGSRNYAAVAAAGAVLKLATSGELRREYDRLRPRHEALLYQAGNLVHRELFPVTLLRVRILSLEHLKSLQRLDVVPLRDKGGEWFIRLCLQPHQTEQAFGFLLGLVAEIRAFQPTAAAPTMSTPVEN